MRRMKNYKGSERNKYLIFVYKFIVCNACTTRLTGNPMTL
jgi:hypothetical protein